MIALVADLQGLVLSILVPVVGVGGPVLVYIATRAGQKSNTNAQNYDQLQEDVDKLRVRLDKVEQHNRVLDDYVGVLRQHISEGKGPPPPPYPVELTGRP